VTLPDKLFEQMDQLIALKLKHVDLMRQLKKGYMLANMIGMHPNQIKGAMSDRILPGGRLSHPWIGTEFVVRLAGEEVARKKLTDVPLELWPDDIRTQYQRHQKREVKGGLK
jgi:hypothetical protein